MLSQQIRQEFHKLIKLEHVLASAFESKPMLRRLTLTIPRHDRVYALPPHRQGNTLHRRDLMVEREAPTVGPVRVKTFLG